MKTSKILLSIFLLGMLSLLTACNNSSWSEWLKNLQDQLRHTDSQGYMIGYKEKNSLLIKLRWSKDGINWTDCATGNYMTDMGVGIGAGDFGALRIVAYVEPITNHLAIVYGLGASFDHSSLHKTDQVVTSAPSIIYLTGNDWLIGFRTTGDKIALRKFSVDGTVFADMDFAPIDQAFNDHVNGRPALIKVGNKIVMAWRRNNSELRIAVGEFNSSGTINWIEKYQLPLDYIVNNQPYGGINTDPTLTQDQTNFYIGFVRQTANTGDDALNRNVFFLYESPTGQNNSWTNLSSVGIGLSTLVNIGGRSDGSVILAEVCYSGSQKNMYKYENNHFTEITNSAFSIDPAINVQFSFIAVGRPPSD
jgi:hypothetical protein